MKKITKISMQQNGERYNLILDEEFFCGITEDTLVKLKLKKGYLAPYINGTRKNKNYICKYVNQQPSHENSDKSIVEGSTTNE